MKKKLLVVAGLALASCMACGALFGCSGGDQQQPEASQGANSYEEMLQKNTLESLIGKDGSLTCVYQEFDDSSQLSSDEKWEWTAKDGTYSVKSQSKDQDGVVQTSQSAPSDAGCGAMYMLDDGEDPSVSVYPLGTFATDISDEWTMMIDCPGDEEESKVEGDTKITTYKQKAEEDEEYYYKSTYTTKVSTGQITSVELAEYQVKDDAMMYRTVLKDINVGGTLDLENNPYEKITGVADDKACKLVVNATDPEGQTFTSSYKLDKDTQVDLMIWDSYTIYSDEKMTKEIDEIALKGSETVVYVKVEKATEADLETVEGEDDASIDLEADEPGTEYVAEDGSVITLGEDGQFYDEKGGLVVVDPEDLETDTTESEKSE